MAVVGHWICCRTYNYVSIHKHDLIQFSDYMKTLNTSDFTQAHTIKYCCVMSKSIQMHQNTALNARDGTLVNSCLIKGEA